MNWVSVAGGDEDEEGSEEARQEDPVATNVLSCRRAWTRARRHRRVARCPGTALRSADPVLRRPDRRARRRGRLRHRPGIADITSVLVIIGLALFIAIGLNPILEFLIDRGCRVGWPWHRDPGLRAGDRRLRPGRRAPDLARGPHVSSRTTHVQGRPRRREGWAGKLAVKLHLTSYLKGKPKLKLPAAGGVLGAGKVSCSRSASPPSAWCPHDLLLDRTARGEEALALADPAEPSGAGRASSPTRSSAGSAASCSATS